MSEQFPQDPTELAIKIAEIAAQEILKNFHNSKRYADGGVVLGPTNIN